MIQNEEMEKINKGVLPLNIIWVAMLISLLVYLLVGLYIEEGLRVTMERGAISTLRNVLYTVSIVILIATKSVRKLMLYGGAGRNTASTSGQAPYQGGQSPALSKYTAATVVSLAMTESIGTFGLVLFILGKNELDLYLFILVSAAAMFMYRPKRDEIAGLARELNRQGPGGPPRI